MKKTRRVIQFLNLFPQVSGRVWVDAFSVVALVRFIMGKSVDASTLGLILGTYAVSSVAKKYIANTVQTGNPDAE